MPITAFGTGRAGATFSTAPLTRGDPLVQVKVVREEREEGEVVVVLLVPKSGIYLP